VALAAAALLVVAVPAAWHSVSHSRTLAAAPSVGTPHTASLPPGRFSKRTFTENGRVYHYQVFLPHDYDIERTWPVVIALHGSAEKGDDGERQVGVGVGPVVREQAETFPAVVVFPQVPSVGQGGRHAPAIGRLIARAVHEVNGDSSRVYLTGISFGGVLAYLIARQNPERFAALVPISAPLAIQDGDRSTRLPPAQASLEEARALRTIPVWIFQGGRDRAVPAAVTREMVRAFTEAGVSVKYTEKPEADHDMWDVVYRDPALWRWIFAQHR
jgi:predicted peptidase